MAAAMTAPKGTAVSAAVISAATPAGGSPVTIPMHVATVIIIAATENVDVWFPHQDRAATITASPITHTAGERKQPGQAERQFESRCARDECFHRQPRMAAAREKRRAVITGGWKTRTGNSVQGWANSARQARTACTSQSHQVCRRGFGGCIGPNLRQTSSGPPWGVHPGRARRQAPLPLQETPRYCQERGRFHGWYASDLLC